MNLISAKGLNCYYSCIASIADYFGIDYRTACGTLWSENELIYNKKHQMYAPTRFIKNLEILGVKLICLNADSCQKSADSIAAIGPAPDIVLVGTDAFHLPWSVVYQLRHRLHYFFGLKADCNRLICFDPLYQAKYVSLPYEYIAEHAFDILCVQKSNPQPLTIDVPREAEAILRQHPFLLADLMEQIQSLKDKSAEDGVMLAKYTETLRDNRLMFQEFLKTQVPFEEEASLFTHALFAKWTAVKNGLYKMAITSNHSETAPSVCELLKELIAEETSIARLLTVFAKK
ncbi:hypothetical protein [Clostridium minihomine]|uniref:hypothetical protein n=1 Tax=Clostridium minihomine TaxID=2045012 RepID=UPI000C768083|nr:hypothetical protein [Clostridium minihomine]